MTKLLVFLFLGFVLPQAQSAQMEKKPVEYGEKSEKSVTIVVSGCSEHPGVYHVERDIELRDMVRRAGLGRTSNGYFHITRIVDGYRRGFGFYRDKKREPELPSFTLKDGDQIYFGEESP